jgi:hypothetical protein
MSSEEVRRLEFALRMRSRALSRGGAGHDRCPGCGAPIAPGDDRVRVGGVVIHQDCLPTSRPGATGVPY